jgi:hypothetical protein
MTFQQTNRARDGQWGDRDSGSDLGLNDKSWEHSYWSDGGNCRLTRSRPPTVTAKMAPRSRCGRTVALSREKTVRATGHCARRWPQARRPTRDDVTGHTTLHASRSMVGTWRAMMRTSGVMAAHRCLVSRGCGRRQWGCCSSQCCQEGCRLRKKLRLYFFPSNIR